MKDPQFSGKRNKKSKVATAHPTAADMRGIIIKIKVEAFNVTQQISILCAIHPNDGVDVSWQHLLTKICGCSGAPYNHERIREIIPEIATYRPGKFIRAYR